MNAFQTAVKFFQDCGLFIYPSLLIMATGLAIAVERFMFLQRARSANRENWARYFPGTDAELASQGLAYYRGGDPTKPVVYEDFLPASAAGIFRSNLDAETRVSGAADRAAHYDLDWMAGAIGHHIHDPYALYEKAAS